MNHLFDFRIAKCLTQSYFSTNKFFYSSVAMTSSVPKLSDSDVNKFQNILIDALKPKEIVDQLGSYEFYYKYHSNMINELLFKIHIIY